MCDKHPAKKYNTARVHKPADSAICMHCPSWAKLLCCAELSRTGELLGRCLLKAPCSPSEQRTGRNRSCCISLGKGVVRGVAPAPEDRKKASAGRNKTHEVSPRSKNAAFYFTESRCLLSSLLPPPNYSIDCTGTPLSEKEAISSNLSCICN